MKRTTSSTMLLLGCISAANMAHGANPNFLKPYAGVDVGYANHRFENDLGNNLFKRDYFSSNVYVGTKLTQRFGIELGMERSATREGEVSLSQNEVSLSRIITGMAAPVVAIARAKMSGWHINLVANYQIMQKKAALLGSVGLKRASVTLERDITSAGGFPTNTTATLSQTKIIARLSGGLQYFFSKHIGARVLATWENTSKLNPATVASNGTPAEARLRNSFGGYLGIVIR